MVGDREDGGRGPGPPPPPPPLENYKLSFISKKKKTGKNFPREAAPPQLELSGSQHACLTVEFYFYFLHAAGSYFLELTDWLICAFVVCMQQSRVSCNKVHTELIKQTLIRCRDHLNGLSCSNAKLCGIKF